MRGNQQLKITCLVDTISVKFISHRMIVIDAAGVIWITTLYTYLYTYIYR